MNSTTVTLAPNRRQTEPSSSPITPPPITTRWRGTSGIASAPTLESTRRSSNLRNGSSDGTEPVAMILGQIETIKDQHFGQIENPKYAMQAAAIHDQAQQLIGMLEDIKAISKAETGLLALNEAEVDLSFVLQKTIRIFREKQGIDVHTELSTLPHVRGDELRIKQLILNVLNACAPQLGSGETIRVQSTLRAQELSLNFSYTGSVASATARSKHGLDLALARLLIALHQGTLEMKTTADRVTIISVKFPALRVL